jgi:hypothetical protein
MTALVLLHNLIVIINELNDFEQPRSLSIVFSGPWDSCLPVIPNKRWRHSLVMTAGEMPTHTKSSISTCKPTLLRWYFFYK